MTVKIAGIHCTNVGTAIRVRGDWDIHVGNIVAKDCGKIVDAEKGEPPAPPPPPKGNAVERIVTSLATAVGAKIITDQL